MDSNTTSTITGASGNRLPDINYFGVSPIKTVSQPMEVTREELKAITADEVFYQAAAIVAMRHGLLRIKEEAKA